ncbi:hypothetical protein L596_010649 [Steinernema carpocapsae]|uniref:Uncharacterized protein n=1 Tax=Steinernema carpocapsae TaxID=34508 RepID=A0A4U5PJH0_STECR|nr:hypothetical protein L596_010649 [Steinernema carpocapsae]
MLLRIEQKKPKTAVFGFLAPQIWGPRVHVDQRLKLYQYANFQPDLNVSPLTFPCETKAHLHGNLSQAFSDSLVLLKSLRRQGSLRELTCRSIPVNCLVLRSGHVQSLL